MTCLLLPLRQYADYEIGQSFQFAMVTYNSFGQGGTSAASAAVDAGACAPIVVSRVPALCAILGRDRRRLSLLRDFEPVFFSAVTYAEPSYFDHVELADRQATVFWRPHHTPNELVCVLQANFCGLSTARRSF
jgi:hypothetical protein